MNIKQIPTPPKSSHPLVAQLSARQAALGLTDIEFARLLRISRPLWWMTRNGNRRVNTMLLSGIVNAFLDLDEEVLKSLRAWKPI